MSVFSQQPPEWDNAGLDPGITVKTNGWSATQKPPAEWFNWLFCRIYNCILEIRTLFDSHVVDYVRNPGYKIATMPTQDNYAITLDVPPTTYVDGAIFGFQVPTSGTNTTTTPTLNVNSLGAKTIRKNGGNAVNIGDLQAGYTYELMYNATQGVLIVTGGDVDAVLLNGKAASSYLQYSDYVNHPGYVADTSVTVNSIVITPNPAITTYVDGQGFIVKVKNTNTSSAVTANANGLGNVNLTGPGNTTIPIGTIIVNTDIEIVYSSALNAFEVIAGLQITPVSIGAVAQAAFDLHKADNTLHVPYITTTNVGNAYSVTVTNLTVLTDGYPLCVKFNAASTGAITLNPNSLGAKAVVDYFGNAVTNARINLIANLRYDSVNGNFQLQGKGGGGNGIASHLLLGDTATADTGPFTGAMPNNLAENLGTYGKTLLNLVTNGSFENGATGWTLTASASVVATHPKFGVSNLRIASTASYNAQISDAFTLVAGHKYYLCGWYAKTGGGNTFISLYDSAVSTSILANSITADTANYIFVSSYGTNPSYTSGKVLAYGAASSYVPGMVVEWDGITVIDLTAAFGAGTEPTQAQMDAIMTALGGWFDGNAILAKIANGGYINNGVLGTPEVLINDPNHIAKNILSGITDLGVTGTAPNITVSAAVPSGGYDGDYWIQP